LRKGVELNPEFPERFGPFMEPEGSRNHRIPEISGGNAVVILEVKRRKVTEDTTPDWGPCGTSRSTRLTVCSPYYEVARRLAKRVPFRYFTKSSGTRFPSRPYSCLALIQADSRAVLVLVMIDHQKGGEIVKGCPWFSSPFWLYQTKHCRRPFGCTKRNIDKSYKSIGKTDARVLGN
jgi:hypothetical protein